MVSSPDAEVLDICRDLIRIDTSNFGDDSGPGERAAAEYVAASLAEVGIESTIIESKQGRASVLAKWGNQDSARPGLLVSAASSPRSSSGCPSFSRSRAACINTASSTSSWAEPRCATIRRVPPRLSTICTAVAPDEVRTLRMNGATS